MRRELGMSVALLVLCLGLWFSNPDFLGQSNAINTLRQISMLGIFATGMGFVIISGGIDLSIGSVIGLTGVLIAFDWPTKSGLENHRPRHRTSSATLMPNSRLMPPPPHPGADRSSSARSAPG